MTWSTVSLGAYANQESGGTNYVLYSNDISNTNSWQDGNASVSSAATIAPDGTLTGNLLTRVSGNGNSRLQIIRFTSDGTKTFSMYVKAGTAATCYFQPYDSNDAAPSPFVACTFGSPPTVVQNGGTGTVSILSTTTEANGWYRIGFAVGGFTAANTNALYCFPDLNTGNGSTAYMWGIQANDGGSILPYAESTDTFAVIRTPRWHGITAP